MSAQRTITRTVGDIDPRYADLRDRRLAAALSTEDRAETVGLDPLERTTCWTHRRWQGSGKGRSRLLVSSARPAVD